MPGKVLAETVVTLNGKKVKTVNGAEVTISVGADGVKVDGASVVTTGFGSISCPKPATPDTSPLLTVDEHYRLQYLAGVLLYYCLAINSTGLPAVTAIESALAHATQPIQRAADRLLAYFRNYPDNILVLKACNMRLHLQSDSSFGMCSQGRSVAG